MRRSNVPDMTVRDERNKILVLESCNCFTESQYASFNVQLGAETMAQKRSFPLCKSWLLAHDNWVTRDASEVT